MSRHCQSSHRLSLLSSHLHRRADIALIGLAVMVSRSILVNAVVIPLSYFMRIIQHSKMSTLLWHATFSCLLSGSKPDLKYERPWICGKFNFTVLLPISFICSVLFEFFKIRLDPHDIN